MKNYYEVLGLPSFANASDVKRAYRRLVVQYHPDRNKSDEAESRIREINEAYTVLGDPDKKSWYDQKLANPFVDVSQPSPRPHRDPAYQRRRPPTSAKRSEPREKELMRKYLKHLLWFSWIGLIFSGLFFIDYVLPYQEVHARVDRIEALRMRSSIVHFNVYLSGGHSMRVYPGDMKELVRQGEVITATFSSIFRTPMKVDTAQSSTRLAYMYHQLLYYPLGLFLSSFLALFFKKRRPELSFNLCILSALLLIMNYVFL